MIAGGGGGGGGRRFLCLQDWGKYSIVEFATN